MNESHGWKRTESETFTLNRSKAKEFATRHKNLPHSPTERSLEPDRVKRLMEVLEKNLVIPFNWAVVSFNGKTYRMNGQHSATAILDFEGTLPDDLTFHFDKYVAENREAMANLFRHFDARWTQRSKADIAGAFQGLNAEIADIDRLKAKVSIEGVNWYRASVEKTPTKNGDDIYSLFFEESLYPFVRWADEVLSFKTPEMKIPAVLAAMYATFEKSESGAREFWKKVSLNSATDEADPTAVLSRELVESKDPKNGKRRLAPGEVYSKSIKAWAAFRSGEKVRNLNVNPKKGWPEIAG